jgi:DNA-binding transcriptional LysR family regulator
MLMTRMNEFDWSDLDARLLQVLVAVQEAGSVTGASYRLGTTQSAVSHSLDKLRAITSDPLFVKSGRGIATTARANAWPRWRATCWATWSALRGTATLTRQRWHANVTIAANDFQRDLLLPTLARAAARTGAGRGLRVIPSAVPRLDMLRSDDCQLVISPRPPEGGDIVQKRLFEDRYRVFFDATVRAAPTTEADYLAAAHATVVYEPRRSLELDQQLVARGLQRRFAVTATAFSALPAFLRGTDLLATVPGLLALHSFAGLASCEPPVPCPTMPMYAIWHVRYQQDEAHQWLRAQLDAVAAQLRDRLASRQR